MVLSTQVHHRTIEVKRCQKTNSKYFMPKIILFFWPNEFHVGECWSSRFISIFTRFLLLIPAKDKSGTLKWTQTGVCIHAAVIFATFPTLLRLFIPWLVMSNYSATFLCFGCWSLLSWDQWPTLLFSHLFRDVEVAPHKEICIRSPDCNNSIRRPLFSSYFSPDFCFLDPFLQDQGMIFA